MPLSILLKNNKTKIACAKGGAAVKVSANVETPPVRSAALTVAAWLWQPPNRGISPN